MSNEERQTVNGALIRGAEGDVYFIPDEVLQKHKVEGEGADAVREAFGDDEVSGFGFDFSGKLSPEANIQPMTALQGPFGSGGLQAGVGDEPTDVDAAALQYYRR